MSRKRDWLLQGGASLLLALVTLSPVFAAELEEIVIWGEASDQRSGPGAALTPEDLVGANLATTEDLVKYEPGLIVRRRFIGDANGTLGIRGANMFQTARSMVFADGVPLHYLLQSRWNGAPRWSMIAASEIQQVDILYGPFSAEYGGNAMGGVILMESRIPQESEFHFDSMLYFQDFSAYGFQEVLPGYKSFLSYGNKLGDVSFYLSYNHLENKAQPQSFHIGAPASGAESTQVSGAIAGRDQLGRDVMYYGDSGVIDSVTDNFKLKLGYDLGAWSALLNVVYEDRVTDADRPRSYLRNASGEPVWSGNVGQDASEFFVPASSFGISEGRRDSLSAGLRIRGQLSDSLSFEGNLNRFSVLRDENLISSGHPASNNFTLAGQLTDSGDTGWRTAEIKLSYEPPSLSGLSLTSGLRREQYHLHTDVLDVDDYRAPDGYQYSARSGGETVLDAAFVQVYWDLFHTWEVGLGARYESWESRRGYHGVEEPQSSKLELARLPGQQRNKLSPKFSLGYFPHDLWSLRYSLARAYRFPIVEELFSRYQAFNAVNHANPNLEPEAGLHHNLMLERKWSNSVLRLNLFQEVIDDVIEAQSTYLPGGVSVRTFLPVSRVKTRGAELVVNLEDVWLNGFDLRFNMAHTRAEIIKNSPDPAIEGKRYPRMPDWRANLLGSYRLTASLDIGAGLRYAASSFGRLDNRDTESEVFGAQDGYLFVDLKANWALSKNLVFGLGLDNVFNKKAFVTHPWPMRTLFLEGKISL